MSKKWTRRNRFAESANVVCIHSAWMAPVRFSMLRPRRCRGNETSRCRNPYGTETTGSGRQYSGVSRRHPSTPKRDRLNVRAIGFARTIQVAKAPLFVVPVDFAPETEATVLAACALAKKCGAHIDLLEVVLPRAPSLLGDRADVRSGTRLTSKRDCSRLEDSIDAAKRSHERPNCRLSGRRGQNHRVVCATHESEAARH
jgi:hypothetical protein